jgi:hypothetical protein
MVQVAFVSGHNEDGSPRIEKLQRVRLLDLHRERARREVACVACARRTWNMPSRMVLRRMWDNRTPKEIGIARERWRRVTAPRGFAAKEEEIERIKAEDPGWSWDPHDEHPCFYETGGTGSDEAALLLRERAQRRIAEKLGPLRYCDTEHYPQVPLDEVVRSCVVMPWKWWKKEEPYALQKYRRGHDNSHCVTPRSFGHRTGTQMGA